MTYKAETQNESELESLLQFMEEKRVNLYLEVGLYSGSTFKRVHDLMMKMWGDPKKFLMIGLELPTNNAAFNVCYETVKDLPSVCVHWTSSTDPKTVESVIHDIGVRFEMAEKNWNEDNQWTVGLMFIDGDHSFNQTKDDYLAYHEWFDYVAFNDISPRTIQQNRDKHRAIGERDIATAYHVYEGLKLNKNVTEVLFDDPTAPKARGIGILSVVE